MKRRIIVLTKSAKHNGYCVAGIDFNSKRWVRLVTEEENNTGALSKDDVSYNSEGIQIVPLDVIDVETSDYYGTNNQVENCLLQSKITKPVSRLTINGLVNNIVSPQKEEFIFKNTREYLTEKENENINQSLLFVEVEELVIESNEYEKAKASFMYNGRYYENFSITDKKIYKEVVKFNKSFCFKKAYIVVSLPAFAMPENRYYKFIAQVFDAN